MYTRNFNVMNESLFDKECLAFFNDGNQFGFNNFRDLDIKRVGYAVNLTRDIIEQAKALEVDLILTHHNVWDEMLEMREDCLALLKQYGLVHYFNHLPLDSSTFGPTRALARDLKLNVVTEISKWDQFAFGVIGEYDKPITLTELEAMFDQALGHKSRVWQFNDRPIKRVGIVAGSAGDPASINEAHLLGCDAYITGEKKLKTIQYCEHIGMNFLLGSHTFTERAGITAYAQLLQEKMPDIEFIPLKETHIE